MSIPGTAKWLREQAKALQGTEIAEGLLRAANRIERLQGELSLQKTGVDQSRRPLAMTMTPRGPAKPAPPPGLPVFRVSIPDNNHGLHNAVFDWVNSSERLGMGLLNGAVLRVNNEPEENGAPTRLGWMHHVTTERVKGRVALMSPTKGVWLTDCSLLYVDTDDGTTIELVAKEVKQIGKDDDAPTIE